MQKGSLKFLADEQISPVLIRILNHVGEKAILRFSSNFPNGTADEKWIPEATRRGFVCVTYDRKMLMTESIAPLFKKANARVIFIGNHLANVGCWDQALWMLKHWRKIRQRATTMTPGELLRVHKNGRIVPVTAKSSARSECPTTPNSN